MKGLVFSFEFKFEFLCYGFLVEFYVFSLLWVGCRIELLLVFKIFVISNCCFVFIGFGNFLNNLIVGYEIGYFVWVFFGINCYKNMKVFDLFID